MDDQLRCTGRAMGRATSNEGTKVASKLDPGNMGNGKEDSSCKGKTLMVEKHAV